MAGAPDGHQDGKPGMPGGMMAGMMGEHKMEGMPSMPQMMEKMMPHCLEMMLPQMPKEKRGDFALKLIKALIENGISGMSDEEKKEYANKINEAIRMAATAV
jgi:hypothetical protein